MAADCCCAFPRIQVTMTFAQSCAGNADTGSPWLWRSWRLFARVITVARLQGRGIRNENTLHVASAMRNAYAATCSTAHCMLLLQGSGDDAPLLCVKHVTDEVGQLCNAEREE